MQAPISRGGSKDRQTTSTLSITPQKEDDGAKYRCVVWNRAMPDGHRLETTVTLNVNCKYLLMVFFSPTSLIHHASVSVYCFAFPEMICQFREVFNLIRFIFASFDFSVHYKQT